MNRTIKTRSKSNKVSTISSRKKSEESSEKEEPAKKSPDIDVVVFPDSSKKDEKMSDDDSEEWWSKELSQSEDEADKKKFKDSLYKHLETATSDTPSTPPPKPKMDLETFYSSKGLSLIEVRRMNRNYVGYEGPLSEARGIYWDSYEPPEGYTEADLPELEDMPPLPKKTIISPAIISAAQWRLGLNRRKKPKTVYPNREEFLEILNNLKRKSPVAPVDKENSPKIDGSTTMDSNLSSPNLFGNSAAASESPTGSRSSIRRKDASAIKTRKLFSSPAPGSPKTFGDFVDDDDDELFSQMELPAK